MNSEALIESLIEDTFNVIKNVKELTKMDDVKLNYKSSPDRWSVLECIEHLNIADAHYLWQFENKLENGSTAKSENFKPGFLGSYFVKAIKPKQDGHIPNPMKTLQKFRPEVKAQYDTINKFFQDQDKLVEYLKKSRKLDLNKNKISSAVGRIVTFKLGDAFRFLIAHNQRHVIQMQNVVKEIQKK